MSVPPLNRNGFELTSIEASRTLGILPAYGPPGPQGPPGEIDEAAVIALVNANQVTAGAGLVKIGNEIRLAIGALPLAG